MHCPDLKKVPFKFLTRKLVDYQHKQLSPRSDPVEAISCISDLNTFISEAGLHRRTTLPRVIFDHYSPAVAAEKEGGAGFDDHTMAQRRGKVIIKRKKPPKSPVAKVISVKMSFHSNLTNPVYIFSCSKPKKYPR